MTDGSSKNKSTWNISDGHVASCLTGFSSREKLWHCPADWLIQETVSLFPGARRTGLQSPLSPSCKAPEPASLHPNAWNKSLSSHCGVLIILITSSVALLNGLFCRNSIKLNVFNAGGIRFCALKFIPQWYPRLPNTLQL